MIPMSNPMFVFSYRIIFIILFICTTAMAETPLTHAMQNDSLNDQAIAQLHPTSGMHWQLLPGEDIAHIARAMFPKDAAVREKFIRAVIHLNPELFPSGRYQPLPSGAMVRIPDLRTIHAFSAPVSRNRQPAASGKTSAQPQQSASDTTDTNRHSSLLQLTTQLERLAENQAQELNSLIHQTETLASQVAEMQSMQITQTQDPISQNVVNQPLPQPIVLPEQHIAQPSSNVTLNTPTTEDLLSVDVSWTLGALLIVLIFIIIVRSYRKVQQRLTQTRTHTEFPAFTHRHGYEALFRKQDSQKNDANESIRFDGASSETTDEAREMIKNGNAEGAVLFLQKQLSLNAFDISGWLLLFEILYSQRNKADFKKNARRFKRLGIFPDIWLQVQNLGHRLEADEPLYLDEQKRQQRFFPDSFNSKLSSSLLK